MSLLVVGLNHRTAPVRLLERAAVPAAGLGGVLAELLAGQHVAGAVVLSTCNRVEVYASISAFHGALGEIGAALSARTGVHLAKLADYLSIQFADEAVRHLFGVVCGLDSMVVGESQILGQIRDAYAAARSHGGPDPLLHEAMQQALRVGKRVHAETAIDQAGQSVVSAALRVAQDRAGTLAGRPALVLGAGSMGALAATTLHRAGIGPVTVLNRTAATATRVARGVHGTAGDWDDLRGALAAADVVVTATGATSAVVTHADVAAALAARGDRELLILDLAVPRDTERAVDTLPGVTVLDIEQLGAALAREPAARDVDAAWAIVDAETEAFVGWQRSVGVAPTVVALRAHADEVIDRELTWLSQRLPSLEPAARAEVERTVRRVVSTLLHRPTVRMKELASAPGGDRYAAAVRELFLLEAGVGPGRGPAGAASDGAADGVGTGASPGGAAASPGATSGPGGPVGPDGPVGSCGPAGPVDFGGPASPDGGPW